VFCRLSKQGQTAEPKSKIEGEEGQIDAQQFRLGSRRTWVSALLLAEFGVEVWPFRTLPSPLIEPLYFKGYLVSTKPVCEAFSFLSSQSESVFILQHSFTIGD
jgi:hypothetical protein